MNYLKRPLAPLPPWDATIRRCGIGIRNLRRQSDRMLMPADLPTPFLRVPFPPELALIV